jgi:hypothetical protein
LEKRKQIAVGVSKLLYFTLNNIKNIEFDYILDTKRGGEKYEGLDVSDYKILETEDIYNMDFYIFAVSNHSLRIIMERLSNFGVDLDSQVFIYSDLFKDSFKYKIHEGLLQDASEELYNYVKKETLNSKLSVHTTVCGSWLFLEALKSTKDIPGHIAEVGCYEGGNMLLALRSGLISKEKNVLLFDSFEGFPSLSEFDPKLVKKGDYKPEVGFDKIKGSFDGFENVRLIKGFVPHTFQEISNENNYSLVFFDCDLYQPCLDTLRYFWPKLSQGGLVLIHDYYHEPDGFSGVERATGEFCEENNLSPIGIWESTMAVLRKE